MTGQPLYPVERTLLTTCTLAMLFESRAWKKRIETEELKISYRGGISVGDRQSDVELAQRTSGRGVLVLTGYGKRNWKAGKIKKPDYVAKNFSDVTRWILKEGAVYG